MRKFGGLLLVGGVAGFLYCSSQLEKLEPVPEGLSISEAWRYPSGKWETLRYACAGAGVIGVMLALFPQGR